MMKKFVLVAAIIGAGLIAGACGKSDEEKIEEAIEQETGAKADVSLEDNSFRMTSKDGEFQTGDSVKLPKDFPDDVLVYKGATPKSTIKQQEQLVVTLSSADAPAKVFEAYQKAMTDKGWKEESAFQSADSSMLSYSKGEERKANISISKDGEKGSMIVLALETLPKVELQGT